MFATSLVHINDVAEDIAMESLVILWEKMKTQDIQAVKNFLFKMIKNKSLDYLKHIKVRRKVMDSLDEWEEDEIQFRVDMINDTNGALMAKVIPGLYFRKDLGKAYMFDHLEIKHIRKTKDGWDITLYNPTNFDAEVTVLSENKNMAETVLVENAFVDWTNSVKVKAGKISIIKI